MMPQHHQHPVLLYVSWCCLQSASWQRWWGQLEALQTQRPCQARQACQSQAHYHLMCQHQVLAQLPCQHLTPPSHPCWAPVAGLEREWAAPAQPQHEQAARAAAAVARAAVCRLPCTLLVVMRSTRVMQLTVVQPAVRAARATGLPVAGPQGGWSQVAGCPLSCAGPLRPPVRSLTTCCSSCLSMKHTCCTRRHHTALCPLSWHHSSSRRHRAGQAKQPPALAALCPGLRHWPT